MKRALIFARRNLIETLRSPVSWIFGLIMPLGIFVIMQTVVGAIGDAAANVPMFGVSRFTGGVVIFGASFLSLFAALIISSDRKQSFLARLFASPMTGAEYIAGYVLGIAPVGAAQLAVTFVAAMCFGLNITWNILAAALMSAVAALLFIAVGVIMGSLLSAKNAPPVCSAVVQVATLLSGMWFDLDMIGGGFSVFCHVLPFANCYDMIRYTLAGDYGKVWLPAIVVAAYTAALAVGAIVAFDRTSRRL